MSWIIGDGHVHIHPSHNVADMLRAALTNLQTIAAEVPLDGPISRFLLLTESSRANGFTQLKKARDRAVRLGDFTLQPTDDHNTLELTDSQGESLFVVAGRQIVAAEGLEVLALGLNIPYADGKPIQQILEELSEEQCLRVLPWGAGKWLGRRGRILQQILDQQHRPPLFLGDNGNRPFFWPLPKIFPTAAGLGIRNLPGSDPLPFAGQEHKVGGYGFRCPGRIVAAQPFTSLRTLLHSAATHLIPHGRQERVLPFFKHQITMQLTAQQRRKDTHAS